MIGLLGALGFSIGKQVNSLFTVVMGSLAWAGPLLCLAAAILLWIYSPKLTGNHRKILFDNQIPDQIHELKSKQDVFSKGISLPAGKLVTLQGFDQYFSSPDMAEIKDPDVQGIAEMREIGRDFPSYFGTGETVYSRKLVKMTTLNGLKDYFEEVDAEERFEKEIPRQVNDSPREISKTSTEKSALFSSIFKSKADQEEFLAKYKVDGNPLEPETFDFVENLREESRTIDEAEKIAQAVEYSVSKTVSTSLEMPEYEAQVAAALEMKPNFVGQVAHLADKMPDQPEGAEEAQVMSTVEKTDRWKLPDFDLLDPVLKRVFLQDTETSKQLEKVLLDFGVKTKVIRVTRGPVITRYELTLAPGVKISKIVNLADDIALGLAARDVRIEAPIPGKAAIGIEVPNKEARPVPLREVLETTMFGKYSSKLKVAFGKDIADQPIIGDLIKMPHLLIAGATGSGKSVCITSIINSILFNATPEEVKFLLVDPKMVELGQYNGIPHLLAPVVVDSKKAASALKWIVQEMENRYVLFATAGVRDIERYNKIKAGETINCKPAMPFIVVIIDELADLMMVAAGEVEEAICRLAQMARAAGIHLVIATQRPSVDVITGVIKANIPSRISFAVSSQIDSRTILDATGAEKLLGRGDMLYSPLGVNKALRVQGCLITDDEVQRVITYWKESGRPDYLDPENLFAETTVKKEESNGPDDVLFIDAGQLFIRTGIASISFLQRKLKLGYTRAARLMDMLQEQGVVGTYEGSKPRQVLLTLDEFNERFG
jgi:S-DNA-T family DNA segregation ATPase FtsK/SpoIIIE